MTGQLTERTPLNEARERLLADIEALPAEEVSLPDAAGRAVAEPITAARAVPHYRRAAMDGYAVRSADTVGASERSPVFLSVTDTDPDADEAVPVHTGSAVPESADAVVPVERTKEEPDGLAVFAAVGVGANVAPVGEDVEHGERLCDAGRRLRPSDLGLLRATGVDAVRVRERPRVTVLPTGEELVAADPEPGEVIETNGLTVGALAASWDARVERRDPVSDDRDALRAALRDAASRSDIVVTTGGSSVGERDLVPDVVADLGGLSFHGVALKPGHPVAAGDVDGTPALLLPGYPVSCLVNAVQFLRPALAAFVDTPLDAHPTTVATLAEKIRSEPGVRTFARVSLDGDEADPVSAAGAGVLSSVTRADGWVEVAESKEGIPAGTEVGVQRWEP